MSRHGTRQFSSTKKSHFEERAVEELQLSVGIFNFDTSSNPEALTPAQWIEKEEVVKEKIDKNVRFHLGNGRSVQSIEEAVNDIFNRLPREQGKNTNLCAREMGIKCTVSETGRQFGETPQWIATLRKSERQEKERPRNFSG